MGAAAAASHPGPLHPTWCTETETDGIHRSTPVTVWRADGVEIRTAIEQSVRDRQPVILIVSSSKDRMTAMHLPQDQAAGLLAGLYSAVGTVDGTRRSRTMTSTRQTQVRTLTVRDGRRVIEKRVILVERANPTDPILSLSTNEARSLGRRLATEAQAIEGGVR